LCRLIPWAVEFAFRFGPGKDNKGYYPKDRPERKAETTYACHDEMRMSRFLSRIQRPAKTVRPPTAHPTRIKHPTKPANITNTRRGGAEADWFVVQALSGMAAIRIKPARYRSAIETYNMVIAPEI
jgi:hypothetical protein